MPKTQPSQRSSRMPCPCSNPWKTTDVTSLHRLLRHALATSSIGAFPLSEMRNGRIVTRDQGTPAPSTTKATDRPSPPWRHLYPPADVSAVCIAARMPIGMRMSRLPSADLVGLSGLGILHHPTRRLFVNDNPARTVMSDGVRETSGLTRGRPHHSPTTPSANGHQTGVPTGRRRVD